uniref:Uncharacterized protein n=1 Tax=Tanacetum cinerariifolium TaxID=118510 RepID=A0A699H622_TANCI|nr:hypothetical protein [Tanacetum cinerariifolium]
MLPYPRFTKLIMSHYMTAFPEISRRARDRYHNLKDDVMIKSIFNSVKNKTVIGMRIPDWMITKEMKLTKNYRFYGEVFRVDVPTTQSQQTMSTQGTHRTTSSPRTPTPVVAEGESSAQRSSPPRNDDIQNVLVTRLVPRSDKKSLEVEITDVVPPVNVNDEEEETADNDYELKRGEKGNTPSPTTIRSPRIHSTLISLDKISSQMNDAIDNQIPSHVDLPFVVRSRDQDDPHDDAHPEGENSATRQKTSEHGTIKLGGSSSGLAIDDHVIPNEKVSQELVDKMSKTIDEANVKTTVKEILVPPVQPKPTLVVQSCQRDPKAPTMTLVNQDLLYLKKGIEKYKVFFIVSKPVYGIIYKNIKKEKRVMRHQEVHKCYDATLKRVLEGLKSYNNDVKYGYVTHSLSKEDVEYL